MFSCGDLEIFHALGHGNIPCTWAFTGFVMFSCGDLEIFHALGHSQVL